MFADLLSYQDLESYDPVFAAPGWPISDRGVHPSARHGRPPVFEERFGLVILEGYGSNRDRVDDDLQRQRRRAPRSTASASPSGERRPRSGTRTANHSPPARRTLGEVVHPAACT